MAKFGGPLAGTLWITQTYHMGIGNLAIDFSAVAETPVPAMADGVVRARSTKGGSYIRVDKTNSNIVGWYTHVYKWTVAVGTAVKKGQIIGYVAPTSHNGGYPPHIHMGLSYNDGTPGYPRLMDYMDRRLSYNTRFAVIANGWFNGYNLNWNLHKDLSYFNKADNMKIGNKVEFGVETRLRVGHGTKGDIKSRSPIRKGAVGTIIGGPRTADGYTWWDVKFLDDQGWCANVGNSMKITTKAVTRVNGTIPAPAPAPAPVDPCKAQNDTITKLRKDVADLQETQRESSKLIQSANDQIGVLQVQIKALEGANKKLETANANYRNIEDKLLEDIKILSAEREEFKKNARELALEVLDLQQKVEDQKNTIDGLKLEKSCNLETLKLGDFIAWVGLKFGIGKK